MDEHTIFTEEALKAQDGKKVPLTMSPGGPVVGEATMHYDSETKTLQARFVVTDPEVADFFKGDAPSVIFRKGN